MTTYKHLSSAIRAAETQVETATEPLAIVEWFKGSRFYEVKTLRKAERVAEKPDAKVVVRFYPGTLDGLS
jgi:hypothetical protein